MDPFILVCGILFIVLIIIIIIASYNHVHKASFKPKFVTLSDNSIQMEFYNFGGIQKERTRRFYSQYTIGMEILHQNKKYKITEFKEIDDSSTIRVDKKIVAYLEEIK
ncbi:MAG: hypothetical protein LBT51_00870 [Fusobacteriaceae bacterium]|jgi:hypothetical protein|nr:hypothetical protein [Fusobacteriaceae bacterium]